MVVQSAARQSKLTRLGRTRPGLFRWSCSQLLIRAADPACELAGLPGAVGEGRLVVVGAPAGQRAVTLGEAYGAMKRGQLDDR
jgi:hypothetical protein